MGFFSSTPEPTTRAEVLDAAAKAVGSGDRKRALALYGAWLEGHRDDHEVHAKVAPLHVEAAKLDYAFAHFEAAALGYARRGFAEKAVSLLRQGLALRPERVEAWESIANLQLSRAHRADALRALDDARASYRARRQRPLAARVLEKRCALDPEDTPSTLDLATLRRKLGDRAGALRLLNVHLQDARGPTRRRVRRALFVARPTPAALWRWLREPR